MYTVYQPVMVPWNWSQRCMIAKGVLGIEQWLLQEYNMSKRLEHGYKSIFNDGRTISAVDPKQYSRRFQEFLKNIFV